MNPIHIHVPGIPVPQGRPRFVRATGHTYKDARTAAYAGSLAAEAKAAMKGRKPLEGPVGVILGVILPIPASWSQKKKEAAAVGSLAHTTRPDLDNFIKQLDALKGIVWVDDSQIESIFAAKRYGAEPSMNVFIRSRHSN